VEDLRLERADEGRMPEHFQDHEAASLREPAVVRLPAGAW
jgi:hypothetical protein